MPPLSPSMVIQSLPEIACTCKLRPVGGNVDRHAAASDDAGLAHLARHQRGMGGAGADRRHDARRDRKAGDIGRAGIGPHQDHRVARGGQAVAALSEENAARPTAMPPDAPIPADDRLVGRDQGNLDQGGQIDAGDPLQRFLLA